MWKHRFLYGLSYTAVEHTIDAEGHDIFHGIILQKNKAELKIKNTFSVDTFAEVTAFLKANKQTHLVLIANTSHILTKSVRVEEKEIAANKAFPSLSLKDFYIQTNKSAYRDFVSLGRKEYIDKIIASYREENIYVLDFYLGNSAFFSMVGWIPNMDQVFTSNAMITIGENGVQDIKGKQFAERSYDINGLRIDSKMLLSLGAIVNFYLKKHIFQESNQIKEFTQKSIYTNGVKAILITIFGVLLCNFLFFNHYYKEVNSLNNQLIVHKESKDKLQKLTTDVNRKKKLLAQIQSATSANVSRYMDELLMDVPQSIALAEVHYQPFTSTIKEGKTILNKDNSIEVLGVLKNNKEFSTWIDALEHKSWILRVGELSIEKDKRKAYSKFYFTITLKAS